MQESNFSNLSEFLGGWQNNNKYFDMLALMASLSRLFSESDIPYLDYRSAENLFCKYYEAKNEARSCTAYDATFDRLGIGIKTFILKNNSSVEKVAEFNRLSNELTNLRGIDLAKKLSKFRNERIDFANNMSNIVENQYHIIGRSKGILRVFNVNYDKIDLERIRVTKNNNSTLHFTDEVNEYVFNTSKTVLMKRFNVPNTYKDVNVELISDPLSLLESLIHSVNTVETNQNNIYKGYDYVILPLYSTRGSNRTVPLKSGLNQWNANGRHRNENEVYIPIPREIHKLYPNFFLLKTNHLF
jgi:hypothetical protein